MLNDLRWEVTVRFVDIDGEPVKFRFYIQELWERKSLQILYECWRRVHHALVAQLFIVIYKVGHEPMLYRDIRKIA
jgi:hypothetical protein